MGGQKDFQMLLILEAWWIGGTDLERKLDEKLDECFKFFTMEDLGNLRLILKISPLIA